MNIRVVIFWGTNVLLRWDNNAWVFPGGSLEFGKTIQESFQVFDLRYKMPRYWTFVGNTLFMYSQYVGGGLEGWTWFSLDLLPTPLAIDIAELQKFGLLTASVVEKLCS